MGTLLFLVALLAGFIGTWGMRRVALRFGFVSHPNPIVRDHRIPVPYLGGLGVLFGISISLCFLAVPHDRWLPALCGFASFCVLGLIDDLTPMPPIVKVASQLLVAGGVVGLGVRFGYPGIHWELTPWSWVNVLISCLWLVTVVNAMNFIDVCDGLAASVAAATLLCWAWLGPSGLYIAAAGATLGFLWWNYPPARIYLGDSGSQALGFLIAIAALDGVATMPHGLLRVPAAVLWVGVPIFELIFITVVRLRKGLPWWKGSPDHFALRLQRAGMSKARIDLLAAVFSVVLWVCGTALAHVSVLPALLIVAIVLTGLTICWRLLLSWEA